MAIFMTLVMSLAWSQAESSVAPRPVQIQLDVSLYGLNTHMILQPKQLEFSNTQGLKSKRPMHVESFGYLIQDLATNKKSQVIPSQCPNAWIGVTHLDAQGKKIAFEKKCYYNDPQSKKWVDVAQTLATMAQG